MKKLIITEQQAKSLLESNFTPKQVMLDGQEADAMFMRNWGFDQKKLKTFIDGANVIAPDMLFNVYSNVTNADSYIIDEIQRLYEFNPTTTPTEVSFGSTESAMLFYYLQHYTSLGDESSLEGHIDQLNGLMTFFGVRMERNDKNLGYKRPLYQMKTTFHKIDPDSLQGSLKRYRGLGIPFEFETSKGVVGVVFYDNTHNEVISSKAYSKSGEFMGKAVVLLTNVVKRPYADGTYMGASSNDSVKVKDKYKRQGVMTALYDIMQLNGTYVIPSPVLKGGALMFWQNRIIVNEEELNPELKAYIEKVK